MGIVSDLRYRSAELSDLPAILKIFEETIRTICVKDYSKEQIDAWVQNSQNHQKWVDRIKTQFFLLAVKDDKILGYASLDTGSCLDLLYIHKDLQGKGLAGMLLQKIEEHARNSGYAAIHTFASITALPFFESKGFKTIHPNAVNLAGVELQNFKMIKTFY